MNHGFTRIFVVNGQGHVYKVGEQLSNPAFSWRPVTPLAEHVARRPAGVADRAAIDVCV